MRSESLIRLGARDTAVRRAPNDALRKEIETQTQAFLAAGRAVQVVSTNEYQKSRQPLRQKTVIDPVSRKVISRPSRELVNGRMAIRMPAMVKLTGLSRTHLGKLAKKDPQFPKALPGAWPRAWDEVEFLEWLDDRRASGSPS